MKLKSSIQLKVIPVLIIFIAVSCQQSQKLSPPVAKTIAHVDTFHHEAWNDNYHWIREQNDPEVIAYLNEENKYTDAMLQPQQPLRDKLYKEMLARIKETDMSVPYKLDSFYYYSRTEEGKDYSIQCRKKNNMNAPEEIILDENEDAKKFSYYELGEFEPSPDHRFLAYSVDTSGGVNYNFYFKDMQTGEYLPEMIRNSGSLIWANDNKTIFYTINDEANRAYRVYRHELGSDLKNDALVYEESDEEFSLGVNKSKSKEFIFIDCRSTLSSEVWYLNANKPTGKFQVITPREENHEYSVDQYKEKFYIVTNWSAKNFRLMATPITKTTKVNWKEIIPPREKILLMDVEIFNDYLVVQEREEGLLKIRTIRWADKKENYLKFPETVYSAYVGFNPDFNTSQLRYSYNSFTTPYTVYEYDMSSQKQTLLKQQEVMVGFKAEDYQSERIYAKAQDGIMVPVSLVYKKGFQKNGNNPCLLYSYGAYGSSSDVYFSSENLSLLDRGFVYAIAHIRGGEEMGRQWYEDGKLLHKKNTFTDFIAAAEKLVEDKYTTKDKLVITGMSAGGLLMSAVLNIRPDLFKAAVVEVPFTDVINTMMDASIPLTTLEYDEWGNPNEKEYFDYMKSYSPYDNVKAQNYPSILVRTSLNDAQVRYFEPTKWVAKLRSLKTDTNPLVLRIDMTSGHGGPSGRYTEIKELAYHYAFMLWELGIKN